MELTESPAISAVDLHKTYSGGRGKPPIRALDGLSFAAETGSVFALLGPNGAGKSTTVKILATLSRADSGVATVAGIDVAARPGAVRRAIGYVSQKPVTDPMDTGKENLVVAGRMQGLSSRDAAARAVELLDRFSLTEARDRLVKTYSGGMARKLDVAMGLVHRPRVLFLDEPTTGLDPEARAEMWAEIEKMTAVEEMTVLLTTHYLDEADRLAKRLAIVDRGQVVVEGTPEGLKDELHGDSVVIELAHARDVARSRDILAQLTGLSEIGGEGVALRARAASGAAALPAMMSALDGAGITATSATVSRPSLDDVYLKYTGRSFANTAGRSGEVAA